MDDHHHRHLPSGAAGHRVAFDSAERAEFAELEGDVLVGFATEATAVLADRCERDGVRVCRVLDLGSGPGVGTGVLAQRFPAAQVLAADGSPAMLERLVGRAERLGLANRVEARLVELPDGLETIGPVDVVWASMVLHHVGDQREALRGIRRLLEPDGMLAVVEGPQPLRVVPDGVDLGRPGLWERLDAAWAAWFSELVAGLSESSARVDHQQMIEEAGFRLVVDEVLTLALEPPLDARARRFLQTYLTGTQSQLADHADAADLEALDVLTEECSAQGILHREDALLHASRQLYVARAREV